MVISPFLVKALIFIIISSPKRISLTCKYFVNYEL
jgi:hypothetical protein